MHHKSSSQQLWLKKIKLPAVGLAPMDSVTDFVYRKVQKKYGKPDFIFTEFVNINGLIRNPIKLIKDLRFDNEQKPIIAQLYGTDLNLFYQATILIAELGFDGLDINMGCPAKSVVDHGAGAGLIATPKLAQQIIQTCKRALTDWQNGADLKNCQSLSNNWSNIQNWIKEHPQYFNHAKNRQPLSLSVKTRIGYDKIQVDNWIPFLTDQGLDFLSVHGRTLKQSYAGLANWEEIAKARTLVKANSNSLFFGNGDICSRKQALQYTQQFDLDGVLIGRASMGNPLVFSKEYYFSANDRNEQQQKKCQQITKTLLTIAKKHALWYFQHNREQEKYSFQPMRKHLAWYVKFFPQSASFRKKLVLTNNHLEAISILDEALSLFQKNSKNKIPTAKN